MAYHSSLSVLNSDLAPVLTHWLEKGNFYQQHWNIDNSKNRNSDTEHELWHNFTSNLNSFLQQRKFISWNHNYYYLSLRQKNHNSLLSQHGQEWNWAAPDPKREYFICGLYQIKISSQRRGTLIHIPNHGTTIHFWNYQGKRQFYQG